MSHFQYFGFYAPMETFLALVKKCDREELLTICGDVITKSELWDSDSSVRRAYEETLLNQLYFGTLRDRLLYDFRLKRERQTILLHRRQLLLLIKQAILYCKNQPKPSVSSHDFGMMLLMASDQLSIKDRAFVKYLSPENAVYSLLSEFISIGEYRNLTIADLIYRTRVMLIDIPTSLTVHLDYVDLGSLFKEHVGIALETFLAFCSSLMLGVEPEFYRPIGQALTFGEQMFAKSSISEIDVQRFWSYMTVDVEGFRKAASIKDEGPCDFTLFRKYPLFLMQDARKAFDLAFLVEKLWSGPYWSILSANDMLQKQMPRFLGAIYEKYVNDLLIDISSQINFVVVDPRIKGKRENQLCDAMVVCGRSLVLIETKASVMTADSKYTMRFEILRDELRKKFVQNERGKPKGIGQLANAIKLIEAGQMDSPLENVDISRIEEVFPMLVTFDPIGDTLLISMALGNELRNLLSESKASRLIIHDLCCVGPSSFEQLQLLLPKHALADVIKDWLAHDVQRRGTVLMNNARTADREMLVKRNDVIEEALDSLLGSLGLIA